MHVRVAAVGVAAAQARGSWRSIYLQLFGASALYALSSTLANFAIDTGRPYNGSIYSLAQTAAVCWFVWVPLRARQLPPAVVMPSQTDVGHADFTSRLAMVAVVSIPIIGVWEVFRQEQPTGMRAFRLVAVLVSIVLLASCVFPERTSHEARTGG